MASAPPETTEAVPVTAEVTADAVPVTADDTDYASHFRGVKGSPWIDRVPGIRRRDGRKAEERASE